MSVDAEPAPPLASRFSRVVATICIALAVPGLYFLGAGPADALEQPLSVLLMAVLFPLNFGFVGARFHVWPALPFITYGLIAIAICASTRMSTFRFSYGALVALLTLNVAGCVQSLTELKGGF
jgi:hypothetical protein